MVSEDSKAPTAVTVGASKGHVNSTYARKN